MHIKKKNSIYALIIFFLVISIGLGYSLISTSLSITGGISVSKLQRISFANLVVNKGSVTPDMSPTIRKNSTQTTFTVTLTDISDYYEFSLDIVNDSGKDMMLKEVIKTGLTEEQNLLIDYTVTYSDDEEIKTKDSLSSGWDENIKIIVKFKDGISLIASQTLDLTLNLVYEEDDGSSSQRPKSVYKMISKKSVMDNVPSQYVTALTGIDFGQAPSPTNGQGVYTRSGTENDEFPIKYYRGNVTDNNVLFGEFCWKIVRTTETGGTKLIYNGLPAEDGSCDNTGTASQLENTSAFNLYYNSPADVGYMYGTRYTSTYKSLYIQLATNYSTPSNSNYYYSNSVIYENGEYILQNATQTEWSENKQNLIGYYTCRTNSTSCSTIYYIVGIRTDTLMPGVQLNEGELIDDLNITLSQTIIDNGDGTYALEKSEAVSRKKWYTDHSNYKDYYICSNLVSTTCSNVIHITGTSSISINYGGEGYVYGNDIDWDGKKYTLTDTFTSDNWSDDYETIKTKYHYTCLNTDGFCKDVYYILESYTTEMYYLTLKDGKDIEIAKTEMFTNTTDSTIKTAIDSWYENNITSYTLQLEDTIWCNDRSIAYGPLKSKDEDSSRNRYTSFGAHYRNGVTEIPSVTCPNQNDSFTLRTDSGGTRGYGNNTLKYPVGLLTSDELTMAGNGYYGYSSETYLYTASRWWTMSPAYFYSPTSTMTYLSIQRSDTYNTTNYISIRPSISLKNNIKIHSGTGTGDDPYIVK